MTKAERWVFTDEELKNPEECRAEDIFLAHLMNGVEMGIQVERNGTVTNRWADGVAGVSDEVRALADAEESLVSFDTQMPAENWRNVLLDRYGNFLRFADDFQGHVEFFDDWAVLWPWTDACRDALNKMFPGGELNWDGHALSQSADEMRKTIVRLEQTYNVLIDDFSTPETPEIA